MEETNIPQPSNLLLKFFRLSQNDHNAPSLLECCSKSQWTKAIEMIRYNWTCCEPNETNHNGLTPLHWAAWFDAPEALLSLLLERGANIDAKTKYGLTPIHYAVMEKRTQNIRFLIRNHANINAKNTPDEWTPLHWSANSNSLDITNILLEGGADTNIGDRDGRTPLHIASATEQLDLELMDKEHNPLLNKSPGRQKLYHKKGDARVVAALCIKSGVNKIDKYGNTPLHKAFSRNDKEVIKMLLDNGANAYAVNQQGKIPEQLTPEDL